ncbi:MAG TPA: hypothetical protein VNQ78_06930 [Paracoccus sp. (in: a-proteobacteria)]|uniref:hypothetical protein n=1 Tax=Paracoccus sp. TaxID=267 RepID=UPI002D0AD1A4|nr:hypothetical protein [Paracoccus sp. (in: a-proteobacteria)]HWL56399.1 hypothetical protein [Paracoccus sp. (in: a-proteobacteria)]
MSCEGASRQTGNRKSIAYAEGVKPLPEAKSENPGALAGATGTDIESFWDWFDSNATRNTKASNLAKAVADCDPADQILFLETMLDALRPGWPQSSYGLLMEEAGWWADNSTRAEKKAYMLACYRRLPLEDRKAFLNYITGASA